ncbi:putative atp synthase subunit g [Golovinomyces cichoracearum]|uniref:Putative atp synthase subunit g n=1 Tax=Golovinomyces cichoracearum TaxID=62708 RepID=A0A420IH50_9PEZI|nr:putative atp synthase subunit g [Golovinomyces cichoracearum]
MSALFLRALRRRPAKNVSGAIRRSIARYESTVNQSTLDSGKSNSAAIATAKAADGLSRAASAAGPALKGISKTLGKVGYQTQHIISFVQVSAKNPQEALRQARNLSNTELAAGAVLFAELLGFFTVGEIIGRLKLIGYRGETADHH